MSTLLLLILSFFAYLQLFLPLGLSLCGHSVIRPSSMGWPLAFAFFIVTYKRGICESDAAGAFAIFPFLCLLGDHYWLVKSPNQLTQSLEVNKEEICSVAVFKVNGSNTLFSQSWLFCVTSLSLFPSFEFGWPLTVPTGTRYDCFCCCHCTLTTKLCRSIAQRIDLGNEFSVRLVHLVLRSGFIGTYFFLQKVVILRFANVNGQMNECSDGNFVIISDELRLLPLFWRPSLRCCTPTQVRLLFCFNGRWLTLRCLDDGDCLPNQFDLHYCQLQTERMNARQWCTAITQTLSVTRRDRCPEREDNR